MPFHSSRPCQRVVLTGGPGSGKTAVLEVIRRSFPARVRVLPEAASILFNGGFPRGPEPAERRAAQRAIFHVQRELEAMAEEQDPGGVFLCDRGSLDSLAYWPGDPTQFLAELGTTREAELARYHTVIHLRTPGDGEGYDHRNPARVEDAAEAARIDLRTLEAWEGHPRRFVVESSADFMDKVVRVVSLLEAGLPHPPKPEELAGVRKEL